MSLLLLIALPLVAQDGEQNIIKSIQTVGKEVEIVVQSQREFPVRNELVVLRVGAKAFTKSRSPEGGTLNTLIFGVPARAFETETATGDSVWVQFGLGESNDRWDLGTLNKGQRDRK